jgi:hypothetical protein
MGKVLGLYVISSYVYTYYTNKNSTVDTVSLLVVWRLCAFPLATVPSCFNIYNIAIRKNNGHMFILGLEYTVYNCSASSKITGMNVYALRNEKYINIR